jgi:hypothetical protein
LATSKIVVEFHHVNEPLEAKSVPVRLPRQTITRNVWANGQKAPAIEEAVSRGFG